MKKTLLLLLFFLNKEAFSQIYSEEPANATNYLLITPKGIKGRATQNADVNSVALGSGTLQNRTTGFYNTAIGSQSQRDLTEGVANTATGVGTLSKNQIGSFNSAMGNQTIGLSTQIHNATAFGANSLMTATNGNVNESRFASAFGYYALENTKNANNIAFGSYTLTFNTQANGNIAIGYAALKNQSYANGNVEYYSVNLAIGNQALYQNNPTGTGGFDYTGKYNTAVGNSALFSNTIGYRNTAVGYNSLKSNTIGNENVAIGVSSLYTNSEGNQNTSIGFQSLYQNLASNNTAVGYTAMKNNSYATNNLAIGNAALFSQSFSNANTSFESNNVGIGNNTLYYNNPTSNGNGIRNTAVGEGTMYNNTTGSRNTAFGWGANTDDTGNDNTFFGTDSDIPHGSSNTLIGRLASASLATITNATALGSVSVNADNKIRIGNSAVTTIEGQVAWSFTSDRRLKQNIVYTNRLSLDFIKQLRTVSYNFIDDKSKIRHDGFIAQDIEAIMKELGVEFSGLKKNADGFYSLAYTDFIVPLINAVKQLKAENGELQIENDNFLIQKQKIEDQISKLEDYLKKN